VTLTLRQQILVAIGIGVLALIVVMSGTAPTLLTGLNRGGEGSDNINGRGPLWDELFTYIDKRPVLGYGYAGFWTIRRIDDLSSDQGWPMTGAHSGYVETLLAFGWTGAILHTLTLLICMAAGIRLFRRTGDYTSFLVAAFCLTYLIGGLTEGITIFYPCAISFYFTLLLCVLAVERERPNLEGTRPNAKESLQMD
jgi:O-antigen ligase